MLVVHFSKYFSKFWFITNNHKTICQYRCLSRPKHINYFLLTSIHRLFLKDLSLLTTLVQRTFLLLLSTSRGLFILLPRNTNAPLKTCNWMSHIACINQIQKFVPSKEIIQSEHVRIIPSSSSQSDLMVCVSNGA